MKVSCSIIPRTLSRRSVGTGMLTAIVLRVTDDGRGFDPETTMPLEAAGHYGLVSMRERAAQVGGMFTLTTSKRSGTSVEARIPAAAHA
jgi:signal transduction histidine kinase